MVSAARWHGNVIANCDVDPAYLTTLIGHLFLGKSFSALTSRTTPKVAHYLDVFLHAWLLQDTAPRFFRMLHFVPIKRLQDFLDSADGIYEVR